MSEKIYCGKGKQNQYGIKLNICIDDIPAEYKTVSTATGKTYVRLELKQSKQPDQRGNTHYIEVDTWKPTQRVAAPEPAQEQSSDDLPF